MKRRHAAPPELRTIATYAACQRATEVAVAWKRLRAEPTSADLAAVVAAAPELAELLDRLLVAAQHSHALY